MHTSQNAVPRPLAVIWWTSRESNPVSLLARQMCSRYHYKPMGKNLMAVAEHYIRVTSRLGSVRSLQHSEPNPRAAMSSQGFMREPATVLVCL